MTEKLGYQNGSRDIQRHVEDERARFNLGRQGDTNLANEYGLYDLKHKLDVQKRTEKKFKNVHFCTPKK
ncbi:MAG: hypothetical protein GX963_03665 [Bacteroidales bacterium]|nr:hypothetical protein [Bacteroidales bacterium]